MERLFGVSGGYLGNVRVEDRGDASDLHLGFLPLGAADGKGISPALRVAPGVESQLHVLHGDLTSSAATDGT